MSAGLERPVGSAICNSGFALITSPALAWLFHRKARIFFGLAARCERRPRRKKVAKSNPVSARICRSSVIVFTSSIPKNTVWEQAFYIKASCKLTTVASRF